MNNKITFCSYEDPENGLLDSILEVQKTLIITRDSKNVDGGFLISAFSKDELQNLITTAGILHIATEDEKIVGYILTCPIEEFTDLFSPKDSKGTFNSNEKLDFERHRYLYQIALASEYARKGIGSSLLEYAKKYEKRPLLTDILVAPLNNEASVFFFKRNGFRSVGRLQLGSYRDFGELTSEVLVCL